MTGWKAHYRRVDNAFGEVLIIAAAFLFVFPLAGFHALNHLALTALLVALIVAALLALAGKFGKRVWLDAWNGFKVLVLAVLAVDMVRLFTEIPFLRPFGVCLLLAVPIVWLKERAKRKG